jgi:hypothetical protein
MRVLGVCMLEHSDPVDQGGSDVRPSPARNLVTLGNGQKALSAHVNKRVI